jgi:hypothetical protein
LDGFDLARPLFWLARGLLWLGWDCLVRTVGWSIGWPIWRVATFGRFPDTGFRDLDQTSLWASLVVELTGLGALFVAVLVLAVRA